MAHDANVAADACKCCARNKTRYKQNRSLQELPNSKPLHFVTMDAPHIIPCTTIENQQVTVITDWYSNLTRRFPTAEKTVVRIATFFFGYFAVSYGIATYLLTYTNREAISKSYAIISRDLCIKHLTTTADHLRIDGKESATIK